MYYWCIENDAYHHLPPTTSYLPYYLIPPIYYAYSIRVFDSWEHRKDSFGEKKKIVSFLGTLIVSIPKRLGKRKKKVQELI